MIDWRPERPPARNWGGRKEAMKPNYKIGAAVIGSFVLGVGAWLIPLSQVTATMGWANIWRAAELWMRVLTL